MNDLNDWNGQNLNDWNDWNGQNRNGQNRNGHNYNECKNRWESNQIKSIDEKSRKIIEKCFKSFLDREKKFENLENFQNSGNFLRHLKIFDRSKIWKIDEFFLKFLVENFKFLESLEIFGIFVENLMELKKIWSFFQNLQVRNLKNFGISFEFSENFANSLEFLENSQNFGISKIFSDFFLRCEKLQNFHLILNSGNSGGIFQHPVEHPVEHPEIYFPSTLRRISILDRGIFPKFSVKYLQKCKKNLIELNLKNFFLDCDWIYFCENFESLEKFFISKQISCAELEKFCETHPNLKSLGVGIL